MEPTEKISSPERNESKENKPYQYLVVFGFGVKPIKGDGAEKDDGNRGWGLSVGTKARVLAAGEMYLMGTTESIILSEGANPKYTNTGGAMMKRYLIHKFPEIPDDKIILEDKASNTIENFSGIVDLIDRDQTDKNQDKPSNIALLSNRFHLFRIKLIAEKFGLKGDAFSAEDVLEVAARNREEELNIPTLERFKLYEQRMSTPEGNDIWRDHNEISRRIYLRYLQKYIAEAKQNIDQEKLQHFSSLVSKTWHPNLRQDIDAFLDSEGIGSADIHSSIEQELTRLGKVSYRDYLTQENRWMGGMEFIPEYWVLQAAKVNTTRFREILAKPENSDALMYVEKITGQSNILDLDDQRFAELKDKISSNEFIKTHRKLPPENWEAIQPEY